MAINPICTYCVHYDKKHLDCKQEMYSLFYSGANVRPLCLETEDKYKKHPFISKLRLMVFSNEFLEACGSLALIAWGIIAFLAILVPKPHSFIFAALFVIFILVAIVGFFWYLLYSQVYKPIKKKWKLIDSLFAKPMKTDWASIYDAEEDKNGN